MLKWIWCNLQGVLCLVFSFFVGLFRPLLFSFMLDTDAFRGTIPSELSHLSQLGTKLKDVSLNAAQESTHSSLFLICFSICFRLIVSHIKQIIWNYSNGVMQAGKPKNFENKQKYALRTASNRNWQFIESTSIGFIIEQSYRTHSFRNRTAKQPDIYFLE